MTLAVMGLCSATAAAQTPKTAKAARAAKAAKAALADKAFLQLSSGEQRMVLLARAFVKDPELLILDEPLHGLDLPNRDKVKEIIETFCQRSHKTMVMVTHYQDELPPCIDNHLTLKKNK